MLKSLAASAVAALTLAACTTTTREVAYYPGGGYGSGPVVDRGGYGPAPGQGYDRYDGCADNQAFGTVAGAVTGGVVGSQFGGGSDDRAMAAIGGAILGGIAGNAIARNNCDNRRADAYYYNRSYSDAFDSRSYGRPYEWRNPHSGRYGRVTPIRSVDGYSYGYRGECQEFEQIVYVDGRPFVETGIACRDRDGSWRIVRS